MDGGHACFRAGAPRSTVSPERAVVTALLTLLALGSGDPCVGEDVHGHPFATCFDPWRGLELGGAVLLDGAGPGGSASAALRLRGERESRSKAESTWLTLHAFADTSLRLVDGAPAVLLRGYTGLYRRHVREGVLLLPFTPPVRLPFPLDIALLVESLRYERRQAEGSDWSLEPARLSLLFDPLRAGTSQVHLGIGVTTGWRVVQRERVVVHEFTPLSAAAVFFSVESDDGLWLARGSASAGWSFTLPETRFTFRARGEVELSRVLVAFADHPLSLTVRGSGAWRDAGAREGTEWTVSAGLQVRLFSAR